MTDLPWDVGNVVASEMSKPPTPTPPTFVIANREESDLLFELWRLAYQVTTSKWLPDPLSALDDHVGKMLDAGFIRPETS